MSKDLIKQCYQKSIELLVKNSTKSGFLAARPKKTKLNSLFHYDWIFGRDASICSLGAIASRQKELIKIARRTLITLARQQTKQGQIPNAVNENETKVEYYYLSSIDATLWWLIAIKYYQKYSQDKKTYKLLELRINKALRWLNCQTGGETNLLVQSQGGDWADIMPVHGHALYSNALWYWLQDLYKLKGRDMTKAGIKAVFYPFKRQDNSIFYKKNFLYLRSRDFIRKRIKTTNYFLSYVSTHTAGRHCDVYGNILALMLNLPDIQLKKKIINYLLRQKVSSPYPVRVLDSPILKSEREWNEIMERYNKNKPWHYHNAGIWPYVGGFWVIMLHKIGQKKIAKFELEKLALANKINNWQFNEWLNGQSGQPQGMPGQSWNAATFILAYDYLKGNFKL